MSELTSRQQMVLNYIRACWRDGWMPTNVDLCKFFGWASSHAAQCHLSALKRKGYVDRAGVNGTRLRLTERGRAE